MSKPRLSIYHFMTSSVGRDTHEYVQQKLHFSNVFLILANNIYAHLETLYFPTYNNDPKNILHKATTQLTITLECFQGRHSAIRTFLRFAHLTLTLLTRNNFHRVHTRRNHVGESIFTHPDTDSHLTVKLKTPTILRMIGLPTDSISLLILNRRVPLRTCNSTAMP